MGAEMGFRVERRGGASETADSEAAAAFATSLIGLFCAIGFAQVPYDRRWLHYPRKPPPRRATVDSEMGQKQPLALQKR